MPPKSASKGSFPWQKSPAMLNLLTKRVLAQASRKTTSKQVRATASSSKGGRKAGQALAKDLELNFDDEDATENDENEAMDVDEGGDVA